MGQVTNRLNFPLRLLACKKGQALVEYALVLSLISVLAISVLNTLGVEIRGIYLSINNALSDAFASLK